MSKCITTDTIQMMFIGQNGSMGYINGKVYDISLSTSDGMIWLNCKGHLDCPYQSISSLLKNWKEVKMQTVVANL